MEHEKFNQAIINAVAFCRDNKIFIRKNTAVTNIEDARRFFKYGLELALGENAKHLPIYKPVVEWLTNNKGKSLFVMGKCGTGKSIISCRVIPFVFACIERVVRPHTAREISKWDKMPTLSHNYPFVIDDLGCEGVVKKFGSENDIISEIIDEVDREGYLCVITTNLNPQGIIERYGERFYDRIRGNFQIVSFDEESNR